MVVNFKASGISRGTRKLARTPTLIKKKKKEERAHPTLKMIRNLLSESRCTIHMLV